MVQLLDQVIVLTELNGVTQFVREEAISLIH